MRQSKVLCVDFLAHQREVLELVTDARDARRACAAEIAVVREHAARAGGILLVEQQLQLLLAAVHVGRSQLARQCAALGCQIGLAAGLLALEFLQSRLARDSLRTHRLEIAPRLLRAELGVPQLCTELVALLDVGVD